MKKTLILEYDKDIYPYIKDIQMENIKSNLGNIVEDGFIGLNKYTKKEICERYFHVLNLYENITTYDEIIVKDNKEKKVYIYKPNTKKIM